MPATGKPYGMGQTDYERYLKTVELLSLQKPASSRANEDELLFQVVHQSAELWMKAAIADLERAGRLIDLDRLLDAASAFKRAAQIETLVGQQILAIMTIAPRNYHQIRMGLGKGSGQESPGFNRLLEVGDELAPKLRALLERRGLALIEVHRAPEQHPELFRLLAAALDYDEAFQRFRYNHFAIVRRMIGTEVKSLKGVPAAQLAATTTVPLFPELWEVMNRLTREWKPEY